MPLYLLILTVYGLMAVLMGSLAISIHRPSTEGLRIHRGPAKNPRGLKLYTNVAKNMILSAVVVFVLSYGLAPVLFHDQIASWWAMGLDAVLILAVYDFVYYLTHRFAFHEWTLLRRIHTVHHTVRHPTALESLYLHPVELCIGLALLFGATWLVGPVHPITFTGVLFVYSALNILVHCGLDLRGFPFGPLGFLARKHAIHHQNMGKGNYASLTPVFDRLFGTAE